MTLKPSGVDSPQQNGDYNSYNETEPTILEWIKSIKPSGSEIIDYVVSLFPFSTWITSYNLQWFAGDLVAGVTVGAVVIPQGMAYAKLAQLPVQYGLYSSFMGALVYWIFGTSKDINIGPVAVASIVTASIVADVHPQLSNVEPHVIASALAFLAGVIILLLGLLRVGWLVDLISLAAVSAFITGSVITIVADQASTMLGIPDIRTGDPAYKVAISTFKNLGKTRLDAAMGVTALVILYLIRFACDKASQRYSSKKRFYFFLSTLRTVFVILFFTLISWLVNRKHRTAPKFAILGHIPRGFKKTTVPDLDTRVIKALAGKVPAAIIVLVIEHISIAKSFGRVNNYTINSSQELIAIGATNILGPFLGAYASTGSCSRTAIKSKCGVRTPFAGVVTAGVVLLALYTLTPVFFYVPSASLAGVIIHAVGDLVTPPALIYHYWKISPIDVLIFFTGVIITVFDDIETGVFATIFLSVAVLLYRIFRSRGQFMGSAKVYSRLENDSQMGQTGQTSPYSSSTVPKPAMRSELMGGRGIFLPLDRTDGSNPLVRVEEPESGIFIYRLLDGLNYQNANYHLDHMVDLIYAQTRPTTTVQFAKPGDRSWNDPSLQRSFRTKQSQSTGLDIRPTLKAVILDFSTVNNVDLTSIQVLTDVRTQLDRYSSPDRVQWHFASVNNRWTKRALVAAGFGTALTDSQTEGPMARPRIFDVGEIDSSDNSSSSLASNPKTVGTSNWDDREPDIEMATLKSEDKISGGDIIAPDDFALGKTVVLTTEYSSEPSRVVPVQGTNFPFFHVDIKSALESARAIAQGGLQLSDTSGLASN